MGQNNVFTVARRTLEGHDLVYQSIKFTNEVWALAELKIPPGNNNTLEVVSRFEFIIRRLNEAEQIFLNL